MNRYYTFAILLLVIGVSSVAAIWLFDPNDLHYKQIDLTLKVAAAIGPISAIFFAIVGAAKEHQRAEQISPAQPTSAGLVPAGRPCPNLDTEIRAYFSNLEKVLCERGIPTHQFIELSAETSTERPGEELELLQDFEWSRTESNSGIFKNTREAINLFEAHTRFDRFVLLGEPGAGKTICLQYLTHRLIAEHRSGSSNLIPLFVPFSRWTDPRMDALTFLRDSFAKIAGLNSPLPAELDALLSTGRMVIILDGLNEMPGRRYQHAAEGLHALSRGEIIAQLSSGAVIRSRQDPRERSLRELATSSAVRSHFILSCRTHEFFQSPSWQEVYVLPMDEEQIRRFIKKYMPSSGADELAKLLASAPALRSLAQNPFFLRSMTRVQSSRLTSIENKGQFLEHLYDELLKREAARGLALSPAKITKAVAKIAYQMIKQDMIGSQMDLRLVAKRSGQSLVPLLATGLVQSKQDGAVAFYHQLVQEFFAALALRERWVQPRLSRLLAQSKWIEVINLWHDIERKPHHLLSRLLGMLKQRNSPFVNPKTTLAAYTVFVVLLYNAYAFLLTMLLVDVVTGGGPMLSVFLQHTTASLCLVVALPICIRYSWRLSYYNRTVIGNAARLIGQIRNPITIEPLIFAFQKTKGILNAPCRKQIAEALAMFGSGVVPRLVAELSSANRSRRAGCIVALGIIGDQRAVDPLLKILQEGDVALLLPTIEALGKIGGPKAGPALANAIALFKGVVFWRLGLIAPPLNLTLQQFRERDPGLIDGLKRAAAKTGPGLCRNLAIQALGAYGYAEGVPVLVETVKDSGDNLALRQAAVAALGFIRGPEGASALLELYGQVSELRPNILKAFGAVRSQAALEVLRLALSHTEAPVRRAAVQAIGVLGSAGMACCLIGSAKDVDPDVREEAAWALGRLCSPEGADGLKVLSRDASHAVRAVALESLDYAFPEVARGFFMELAADPSFPEREKAIELLGRYRFPDVRERLSLLFGDLDGEVRQAAAESLARIDSNLSMELKHVSAAKRSTLARRLLGSLRQLLKWEEFTRLVREERLRGAAKADSWVKAFGRVQSDAELKRKFRIPTALLVYGFAFIFVVVPGALTAIMIRGLLFCGKVFWMGKWIAITLVAVGLLTFLPGIRRPLKGRMLSRARLVARSVSIVVILLSLGAALLQFWWITGTAALIGVPVGWRFFKRSSWMKRLQKAFTSG